MHKTNKTITLRIYIIRAMQFTHEHEPREQNVNHHTDGKRLSVTPNATRTISRNIFNSFICGRLRNCNQNIYDEGPSKRRPNRDRLINIQGQKESCRRRSMYKRTTLYTVPPITATRSSGGNTNKQGLNTTNGYMKK